MKKGIVLIGVFGIVIFLGAANVFAGCTVSVSPSQVQTGSTSTFTFLLTNTGEVAIPYVKVPTDLGGGITVSGSNSTGWASSAEGGAEVFLYGAVQPGDYHLFDVTGTAGSSPSTINWTLAVSEQDDGASPISCNTVTVQTLAEIVPTTTPPVPTESIASPGVSGIAVSANASTAVVTWSLDGSASTVVNYGLTSSYGSTVTASDSSPETVSLSGLSASTTYHYQVQSTNKGGTTSSNDATFTTAAAGASTNTTTTTTTTVNTTSTVTNTVVLVDKTPPTVQINTKLEKTVSAAPIIEGTVIDSGATNVGIAKIHYSLDGGKNWFLVSEPNGVSRSSFSFIPDIVEDGNYSIKVRATDKSGNSGISSTLLLIIDRIPPRLIHSLWHVGPLVINTNQQGKRELVPGVSTQLTVQGVGGITKMYLTLGNSVFPLSKNRENGLWEGAILLKAGGSWPALITAIDGGGSKITQTIGEIVVSPPTNELSKNASVSIWKLNRLSSQFALWNGKSYGQRNPEQGKSQWFLPEGTYYIYVSAPGYNSAASSLFSLEKSGSVSFNPPLSKLNLWGMLGILDEFSVNIAVSSKTSLDEAYVGRHISWIEKSEWQGKELRMSIVPSWDPSAASIFTSSASQVIIIPGANGSTVDLLKERGNYSGTFIADPDGEIMGDLTGISVPITLQLDRKGTVEKVLY